MAPRRLPPYVQRVGKKYRGWAMAGGGKRWFGPLRTSPQQAHQDAVVARGVKEPSAFGGSFGARAEEWLAVIRATRAADTEQFYRSKLNLVWRTIPPTMPVERISDGSLRVFLAEAQQAGLSARTISHCRRTLNGFFAFLGKRVMENPVPLVKWPAPQDSKPPVFTEAELASILARIDDPFAHDLAVFIAYTGLRRAEVARLLVKDVNFEAGVVWVSGKRGNQSHPLPPEAADAARRLIALASGGSLVTGTTERARREQIAETFRKWQRKLKDRRFRPHAMRHSIATSMLRRGVSPATVQRFLRHRSYSTTEKYVHMVEGDVRDATSRLRLLPGGDGAEEHG